MASLCLKLLQESCFPSITKETNTNYRNNSKGAQKSEKGFLTVVMRIALAWSNSRWRKTQRMITIHRNQFYFHHLMESCERQNDDDKQSHLVSQGVDCVSSRMSFCRELNISQAPLNVMTDNYFLVKQTGCDRGPGEYESKDVVVNALGPILSRKALAPPEAKVWIDNMRPVYVNVHCVL